MGYDTVSIGKYLQTSVEVLYFNFPGSRTFNLKMQWAPKKESSVTTRVGTLIVATIYLQLIQNR